VLAACVAGQDDEHRPFGGVVPEIAARAHVERLDGLVARVMAEAGVGFGALGGVAATAGPGLLGGVMVGLMTGKAIAAVHGLPFLAINHLEGHALTARLTDGVAFPYLLLLVSGGHCQLLAVEGVGRYRRYGTTIDDAVGEAFDKAAKLLGLGYPGGPAVERAAAAGDAARFPLPRPLLGREGCDFSFSGLKTALAHAVAGLSSRLDPATVADLAASFQAAVADVLADRAVNGIARFRAEHENDSPSTSTGEGRGGGDGSATSVAGTCLVVAGGVAANGALRARLGAVAADRGLRLVAPPPALCTDNAVMIAWAGFERLREGLVDGLDAAPRARWPLDPAAPHVGGGLGRA
jgi:N6-L-threonylcarbamoyladenine synthase